MRPLEPMPDNRYGQIRGAIQQHRIHNDAVETRRLISEAIRIRDADFHLSHDELMDQIMYIVERYAGKRINEAVLEAVNGAMRSIIDNERR